MEINKVSNSKLVLEVWDSSSFDKLGKVLGLTSVNTSKIQNDGIHEFEKEIVLQKVNNDESDFVYKDNHTEATAWSIITNWQ